MSWGALLIMGFGAYLFKLAGVLVGNRLGDSKTQRAVQLIPPAMFAALIALQTFESNGELTIDARIVGMIVAVGATTRRMPFIGVIAVAMAATALTRMIT